MSNLNCNKKVYEKRSWAKKQAKWYKKKFKKEYTTYKCDKCGNYHLTTMDKKNSRKLTRNIKK